MFVFAGGLKLTGAPQNGGVVRCDRHRAWFRYVTASIEVVSAVAILVPAWAAFGALLLIPTIVGAVFTHLFIVDGSAMPAAVLLTGSLAIAWARRDQLAPVLSRWVARFLSGVPAENQLGSSPGNHMGRRVRRPGNDPRHH